MYTYIYGRFLVFGAEVVQFLNTKMSIPCIFYSCLNIYLKKGRENFWWPQFALCRQKIYACSPVGAHVKKLISDPDLAHHPSIPTQWNARPPLIFIIAPSGMLLLNTKLNTREGRGKIGNSFLSKKIHQVTTQRAQIRPPWFRSDTTNIPPPKFIEPQLKLLKPQTLTTRELRCKYQELTINLH